MDIMTGLSAISETLKISKELRQIDAKVSEAEFKLRLSDLIDGLLEAKEALQDAKENERALQSKIADLEAQLSRKGRYEDQHGCLFEIDTNGQRLSDPFCNLCFVREDKLYRLRLIPYSPGSSPDSVVFVGARDAHYKCPNCGGHFGQELLY
ncbi:MAG: hypothetical protein AAF376_01720 [Pseudomonadota bacterium]